MLGIVPIPDNVTPSVAANRLSVSNTQHMPNTSRHNAVVIARPLAVHGVALRILSVGPSVRLCSAQLCTVHVGCRTHTRSTSPFSDNSRHNARNGAKRAFGFHSNRCPKPWKETAFYGQTFMCSSQVRCPKKITSSYLFLEPSVY